MEYQLEHIMIYEFKHMDVKVNGKPLFYVLVGGYSKDMRTFYLDEIHILGDKVKITEEVVIKDAHNVFDVEGEAKEILATRISYRDEKKLLESLL